MKRTPLRRRTSPSAVAANRHARARYAWGQAAREGRCAMCGYAGPHLQGHHVFPLALLKAQRVPESAWYDLRNQLVLCAEPAPNRCHARHELRIAPVPLRIVLIPSLVAFALDHHLEWWLDRKPRPYP